MNFFIIVLTFCLYLLLNNEYCAADDINTKFKYIGNKLVYISDVKVNWYKAMQACTNLGMQLITINTLEDNKSLDTFMKTNQNTIGSIWTSGNDLGVEGTWVWMSTGDKFQYNSWSENEPSNSRNRNSCDTENCLEVGYNLRGWERPTFWWNDNLCTLENLYICEKKF